jgi:polyketide biosynthesis acyl carrier protein
MTSDQIMAALRRNVVDVVPEVDPTYVQYGRSLAELGCNSLDRADIVTQTMAELGITVPVAEFGRVRDITELVALLGRYS